MIGLLACGRHAVSVKPVVADEPKLSLEEKVPAVPTRKRAVSRPPGATISVRTSAGCCGAPAEGEGPGRQPTVAPSWVSHACHAGRSRST